MFSLSGFPILPVNRPQKFTRLDMSSRDQVRSRGARVRRFSFSFVGSLFCFVKIRVKLDLFPRGFESFKSTWVLSRIRLKFLSAQRIGWDSARGLALSAFMDIVAKNAICIIRISLNFWNSFKTYKKNESSPVPEAFMLLWISSFYLIKSAFRREVAALILFIKPAKPGGKTWGETLEFI